MASETLLLLRGSWLLVDRCSSSFILLFLNDFVNESMKQRVAAGYGGA